MSSFLRTRFSIAGSMGVDAGPFSICEGVASFSVASGVMVGGSGAGLEKSFISLDVQRDGNCSRVGGATEVLSIPRLIQDFYSRLDDARTTAVRPADAACSG